MLCLSNCFFSVTAANSTGPEFLDESFEMHRRAEKPTQQYDSKDNLTEKQNSLFSKNPLHQQATFKEKFEFNDRISKFDSFLNNNQQNDVLLNPISDETLNAISSKLTDINLSEFGYDDRTFTDNTSTVSASFNTQSPDSKLYKNEPHKAPKLMGRKPLAKTKPKSTVSSYLVHSY